MNPDLDFDDVRGLVRFAFGKMHRAYFYLVRVKDVGAARAWLLNAHITTARELNPPPTTALQIAFTVDGLKALGVPSEAIAGFAPEFLSGMAVMKVARVGLAISERTRRAGGSGVVRIILRISPS